MSRRAGEVVLRREDDGAVLCENCVLADTFARRLRGLLGRRELNPGDGIVLRPEWSIHTFFMRFTIDVVFADKDQVVVKVVKNLKPWRTATCRSARDVVELSAGECERRGIEVGDRLAWAARPQQEHEEESPSRGMHVVKDPPRERIRVVVGTSDEKFSRLARFLLTRNHFEVETTKRVSKTVDLLKRHEADVVVIDATSSIADAAKAVAAIEALHPRVRIVVVHDGEPPRWTAGLQVSDKWTALESLPEEVATLAADARAWS